MDLILNHDVRGMCDNEDITHNTSLVQFNKFTEAIYIGNVPRILISIGTLYSHNSSRFENCMANILTEEWCMAVPNSSNIHGIMHNVVRNKLSTFGPHAILAITVSLPNNFNLRHDFCGGRTGVETIMTNTPLIIFRISVDDALEYLEHGIGGIHNVGFSFRSSFDYLNYAIIPRYGYCSMDTMMGILHCLQYAEDRFECVLEIQDRFELFMQERIDLIREDIKRKIVVSDTHKIGFIKSRVEELSIHGAIIDTRRMGSPLCSILEETGKPKNLQLNEIDQNEIDQYVAQMNDRIFKATASGAISTEVAKLTIDFMSHILDFSESVKPEQYRMLLQCAKDVGNLMKVKSKED